MRKVKIVALSGYSRSGKDTAADGLVLRSKGVKVALADPVKRIAREVYDFRIGQLWGPSENRDVPDLRYPRRHGPWSLVGIRDGTVEGMWIPGKSVMCWRCDCCNFRIDTQDADPISREEPARAVPCHLTPRHALRMLGDEWGRGCFSETWAQHAIRTARRILVDGQGYSQVEGINRLGWMPGEEPEIVIVPDVRYGNELAHLLRESGAIAIRIRRPGVDQPSTSHASESEQASIPNHAFDAVVQNDTTPEALVERVVCAVEAAEQGGSS